MVNKIINQSLLEKVFQNMEAFPHIIIISSLLFQETMAMVNDLTVMLPVPNLTEQ